MGQKDLAQNDYLNDRYRFADMCNGILFGGDTVVRPEELLECSEDIVYHEGNGRRKIIPDKVRLWNGLYLAVVSVENQTMVDYSMVFRMMKEEAIGYERQWNERERELRSKGLLGKRTRLCWKGKDQIFIPVVPIVIYYGTDKLWDGATCLYDMLEICDIAGIDITLIKRVKEDGSEVACMCKAWDDHRESGRKEGVLETRVESIRNLMKNLSITIEEAMDVLEIPLNDRERCIKLV